MPEMISFPPVTHQCCSSTKKNKEKKRMRGTLSIWLARVCFLTQATGIPDGRIIRDLWWTVHRAPLSAVYIPRRVCYCRGKMFHWHLGDADSDPKAVMNCNSKSFTPNVRLVLKRGDRRLGTRQRMQLHFHYFIAWIFTLVKHIYYDQTWSRQRTDRTNSSFKPLLLRCSFA